MGPKPVKPNLKKKPAKPEKKKGPAKPAPEVLRERKLHDGVKILQRVSFSVCIRPVFCEGYCNEKISFVEVPAYSKD
jgi:hypothetical protein